MGEGRGQIFHLEASGQLVALEESPFELEEHFESLIATHPNLLPGDQIDPEDPRRWLVVGRQVEIPSASTTWALDLLLVDQEGIPTFVELKKGSNPELRRKVVGQMLDYAANAPIFWPPGALRSRFEALCSQQKREPAAALASILKVPISVDQFWAGVDDNLRARKIRLLFVTDRMVPELRRVVEFLNQSMELVEVLAVEVRRYSAGGMSTLVPQVFGLTLASADRKASASRQRREPWTEAEFLSRLEQEGGLEARGVAEAVLAWARESSARLSWGQGPKQGSCFPVFDIGKAQVYPFAIWTYGRVEMQFEYLRSHRPFSDREEREKLRGRVNEVLGVEAIPPGEIEFRPGFPLVLLKEPAKRAAFLDLMFSVPARVRAEAGS